MRQRERRKQLVAAAAAVEAAEVAVAVAVAAAAAAVEAATAAAYQACRPVCLWRLRHGTLTAPSASVATAASTTTRVTASR